MFVYGLCMPLVFSLNMPSPSTMSPPNATEIHKRCRKIQNLNLLQKGKSKKAHNRAHPLTYKSRCVMMHIKKGSPQICHAAKPSDFWITHVSPIGSIFNRLPETGLRMHRNNCHSPQLLNHTQTICRGGKIAPAVARSQTEKSALQKRWG